MTYFTPEKEEMLREWWESERGEQFRLLWFYISIGDEPPPIAFNLSCLGREYFRRMWT